VLDTSKTFEQCYKSLFAQYAIDSASFLPPYEALKEVQDIAKKYPDDPKVRENATQTTSGTLNPRAF
jgi:hypothetical protein